MEFDLARFRDVKDASSFCQVLETICSQTLTSDFWTIALPNELATSAARSPSLFAFQAAQVLLNARALYSKQRVADLLDPTTRGARAAVERHHLFPKGFLRGQGIDAIRDTNQIANYSLVEWGDNGRISDESPEEYVPQLSARFSGAELVEMHHWHALPDGWERMEYPTFLMRRRELIAQVIFDAYRMLSEHDDGTGLGAPVGDANVAQLARAGESTVVEFKSTLRTNLHTNLVDQRMELSCLKTIGAFLNSSGGTLIVGVADDGTGVGIEEDGFENEDKMMLHFGNLVRDRIGAQYVMYVHPRFEDYESVRVLTVECLPARSAVFVKDGALERFYVRNAIQLSSCPEHRCRVSSHNGSSRHRDALHYRTIFASRRRTRSSCRTSSISG
jgi:hypothetical protein